MNIVLKSVLEPHVGAPAELHEATTVAKRGTKDNPIPREEYELGVTWLAERTGLSRKKVRDMLDIVPGDWPRLDAAMSALNDYLDEQDRPR